jgi:RimK family alpha-L-glutamate ligase
MKHSSMESQGSIRLFCITSKSEPETNELLKASCKQRGVEFVPIYPQAFRFDAPLAARRGLLYRVETTTQAKLVEQFMLLHADVSTFYQTPLHGITKADNVVTANMINQQHGIPMPKTYYGLPPPEGMQEVVDRLGGFPVILKAAGGSHGVGVMRIDSLASLQSIADYLRIETRGTFILRQFIDVHASARLIVLDDQVIDSIEYRAKAGDFRTNAGADLNVATQKFPAAIERAAVEAVKVLGWEFGGVDVLMDAEGRPYVLEVNLPCFFWRCQNITGTDISGMMVEYLMRKAGVE